MILILMGVSGSGKTTVGERLASRMACSFFDGDDYHPEVNKAKMRAGIALDDDDRLPWLKRLRALIDDAQMRGQDAVLACSALKNSYRSILADKDENVHFVFLKADFQTIAARLAARRHEFMNPHLLASQFETLEEPDAGLRPDAGIPAAIVVDASRPVEEIVEQIETATAGL